jgi:hypothetical protein
MKLIVAICSFANNLKNVLFIFVTLKRKGSSLRHSRTGIGGEQCKKILMIFWRHMYSNVDSREKDALYFAEYLQDTSAITLQKTSVWSLMTLRLKKKTFEFTFYALHYVYVHTLLCVLKGKFGT